MNAREQMWEDNKIVIAGLSDDDLVKKGDYAFHTYLSNETGSRYNAQVATYQGMIRSLCQDEAHKRGLDYKRWISPFEFDHIAIREAA